MKKMSEVVGAVLSLILLVVIPAHSADAQFKVIVNSGITGRTVPRDVLAKIYLGDVQRWANGDSITAVDLSSTSVVRQAFSEQVVGMSVDAVMHHWLGKVTASTRLLPPKSQPTDEAVIALVAGQRGGVGYVSIGTALPATVHEVAVE